jgi:type VI protein secretion system component VasK
VSFLFWGIWEWLAATIAVAVTATGAFFLARWSWRAFLIGCVVLLSVVFLFVLPWRFPASRFLAPDLPPLFLDHFWTWVLVFVLGILGSIVFLVGALRAARPAARAEQAPSAAGRFPDIEAAWDEILVQFDQARINLASQHVILILGPTEESVAALVESASLQRFAHAPDLPTAPIHAWATADGVLLGASGASAFGTQDVEGIARLETVCRLIREVRPDCPVLRGVVLLFPLNWAGQAESVGWATALRDDLRTVQRTLKVRCPVCVVFSEMESAPGFHEFLGRMDSALINSRAGFAVPLSEAFSGDLINRGLIWMSGWFHRWILSMMADGLMEQAGNNRLVALDMEFRRYRKRFRSLLESALATPRDSEPILFRGTYFVASGAGQGDRGFAPGLLRGSRGRVFAEHVTTEWTAEAEADDRYYRRLAMGVGLGGAALTLMAWVYIIVVTQNSWWWLGLGVVVVAWIVALVRMSRW